MSLRDELRDLQRNGYEKFPEDVRKIMEQGGLELAESELADRALGVGARAPRFALPSAGGREVTLENLLAGGPLILTFYRGAWCPFCNLALRALQQHEEAIAARGVHLVAVSPQIPDESLSLTEKEQLTFDVLSDIGSDVAKQYGIAFELSDELGAVYDGFGFELQRVNAGHARTLPLPATYVIDQAGVIRWAFVQTDYTLRAEPAEILAALDALG